MLVKTYGAALQGIDAIVVTLETATDAGMLFSIVGLPDAAVKESAMRVQTAIRESNLAFPEHGILVNMAPADIRKEGAAFDLPLAMGILASAGQVIAERLGDFMMMGELGLDGALKPIGGVLPMAITARKLGFKGMIVPTTNATEAAVVNNLTVYGADNLLQVVNFLNGIEEIEPTVVNTREEFARHSCDYDYDFADVKGQEDVKRAFEVACTGGHNILLVGPPGAGKSMMAKRLPSILPPLTLQEALETTKIHSVAGQLKGGSKLMTRRPFRAPHHTVSPVALVGGGTNPKPGEISLAHNGLLFLDEFPEFSRTVLEVMRQPLEDRHITVSRAKYTVDYPAGFMLVASMNPCPCGYYNHPTKMCSCAPGAVQRYMSRISGPLLDRIDLQVEIFPVEYDKLSSMEQGESSATIRARVVAARKIQEERFKAEPAVHCNAQMTPRLQQRYCRLDADSDAVLRQAMTSFDLSARAYDRILKVARTIADLDYASQGIDVAQAAEAPILSHHIAEAISYRNLDRSSWGTYV